MDFRFEFLSIDIFSDMGDNTYVNFMKIDYYIEFLILRFFT